MKEVSLVERALLATYGIRGCVQVDDALAVHRHELRGPRAIGTGTEEPGAPGSSASRSSGSRIVVHNCEILMSQARRSSAWRSFLLIGLLEFDAIAESDYG